MTVYEYELEQIKKQGYVEVIGSPGYFVNEQGSVIDMVCGYPRELRRYIDCDGNNIVTIFDEDETPDHVEVGWLVAAHFVRNPDGYGHIVHIDGDKGNNSYVNLVWDPVGDFDINYIQKKEKKEWGWDARRQIVCLETNKVYDSMAKAALEFGVSTQYISKKLKTDGKVKGYHLQFVGGEET